MSAYGYVGLFFGLLGMFWALVWFFIHRRNKRRNRAQVVVVRPPAQDTVTVIQSPGYGPAGAPVYTQQTVPYYANVSGAPGQGPIAYSYSTPAENPPPYGFNPVMAKATAPVINPIM